MNGWEFLNGNMGGVIFFTVVVLVLCLFLLQLIFSHTERMIYMRTKLSQTEESNKQKEMLADTPIEIT